jgi:hypothetical protein
MASLAYFIKTCLQEEKYGDEYVSKLDERLQSLNYSQLCGMQDVLQSCIADSKSAPWKTANQKLLDRVNIHIVPKREEVILNTEKKEAIKRKAKVKRLNQEAKIKEKNNVLNQIKMKAIETAKVDVKEAEYKRQVADKARVIEEVPKAEQNRIKYIKYGVIYFIVALVIICVVLKDPLFLACGIIFALLSTGFIFYYAYKVGIVNEVVVTSEEEIEKQIEIRTEELIQKALNSLKQKEIEFNNKQARDAEERRQYILKKKESAKLLSEKALLQQIDETNPETHLEQDSSVEEKENESADDLAYERIKSENKIIEDNELDRIADPKIRIIDNSQNAMPASDNLNVNSRISQKPLASNDECQTDLHDKDWKIREIV